MVKKLSEQVAAAARKAQDVPDENKTFINEVDDALREERLALLWAKYKILIIGGVLALFVVVAGREFFAAQQHKQAQAAANAYAGAVQAEDTAALAEIAQSTSVFAPLAALAAAEAALVQADTAGAVAQYDVLIENKKAPAFMRDLARLYAAQVLLATDGKAAERYVTPLLAAGSAFRLSALEIQARILMARDEKASALAFYEEIATSEGVPVTLKVRAEQALAQLR